MAFPTVNAQATTNNGAAGATFNMPSFSVGQLLLAVQGSMTAPGTPTSGSGGTWTLVGSTDVGSTTFIRVWAKVAQTGDTFVANGGFGNGGFITSIAAWSGSVADIGYAGTTGSVNPPNLNMTTAYDYLWFALGSNYQNVMSTAPTSFTSLAQATFNTSPAGDHKLSLAQRAVNASSLDPAAFSGTANFAGAMTIAIKPVSTVVVNEAGSSTPTGSVAGKKTTKGTLTGSTTPGASLVARTSVKAVQTGSATPSGIALKAVTKTARTGSTTPTGAVTPTKVILLPTRSGSCSPSGLIKPRTTTKQTVGSTTPSGLLKKAVTKTSRTGSITPSGLAPPAHITNRPLSGTTTPSGSVAGKRTILPRTGSITPVGVLRPKTTTYLLKSSLAPTGHITLLRLPAMGTRIGPAKALTGKPVVGSMVTWEEFLPDGTSVEVYTTRNGGLSYDQATNGRPVPGLESGNTSVTAIFSKVIMRRPPGVFDLPWIDKLTIDIDFDDTVIEWIPLGEFTLDDTEISDDESGLVVSLTGRDTSALVQDNAWEGVFTQPKGTNLGEVIRAGILDRDPTARLNLCSVDAVAPATLTFGANDSNNPLQDFADCAEVAGCELYKDVHGVWTMNPEPDPEIGEPVRTLTDRARTVMTKIKRKLTKSDTRNYIVVTGTSSANTTPARGVAYDDDPLSLFNIFGGLGKRVERITSKLVSDNAAALTMAKARLLKRKNLTETVSISMISDPSLQESDIVALDRSVSKLAGNALIDSMDIPFDVDTEMTIEARKQRLLASGPVGGGVGGLNGDDGGDDTGGSSPTSFTMAFGACINGSDSGAFTYIRDANPDYFAILGDVWYKDGATHAWSADWTTKFAATNYAALLAGLPNPQIVGWSDHDFGYENNATGGDVGASQVSAANAAYRSKFPTVTLPASGIYRTWSRGRIRFILLDMMSFKSKLTATDNSSKTMLGATQKAWYKGLLADSTFPLIVVLGDSQIPGPKEAAQDEWRGYSTERAELQSSLNASPATVLYLNGDTHCLGYGHDQYGYDRVWNSAPFHNNTKVKAAGEGYIETYPTNADESDTVVSELYAIATFTDSGDSIQADCRFFEGSTVKFTDTISVDAPGGTGGGGTAPGTSVGALLKIGSTAGYNHVSLDVGMSAGSNISYSQSDIANGLNIVGYFELATGGTRAKLSDHLDGGTTSSNTQYPRVEFREVETNGTTKSAWDPDASGFHSVRALLRVTKLPSNKPQVCLLQFHDQDDDTCQLRVEGSNVKLTINGTAVSTLSTSFALNTDYYCAIRVEGSGSASVIKAYWGTTESALSTPAYTSPSVGRSGSWYTKIGNYGQSNASTDSVSDGPIIVEMTKFEINRTGYSPVTW